MKKCLLLLTIVSIVLVQSAAAQNVKYTMHTITQGETLSQLAEKYKTTVGDIMRLNGMHADSKLSVGQKIKIPSTKTSGNAKTTTAAKPKTETKTKTVSEAPGATHVVQKGETLYAISKKFNVSVDDLKTWNHLSDNALEVGQVLAINKNGVTLLSSATEKKDLPKAVNAIPDNTPGLKVEEPVVQKQVTKEEQADTQQQTIDVTPVNTIRNAAPVADGESFFNSAYMNNAMGKSLQTVTGSSKIFKTASGWNDRKYYILMNEAPAGSIVKITSDNGKTIYAKVLWKLDDMKENKGINFRLSEAGAAALGLQNEPFSLTITFPQ